MNGGMDYGMDYELQQSHHFTLCSSFLAVHFSVQWLETPM